MNICRSVGLVIAVIAAVVCATGCKKTQPPPETPPVATSDRVAEIRAKLSQQSPGVVVVAVTEVLAAEKLASAGPTAQGQFHIGDIVIFIDTNTKVVATGRITRLLADSVHARWEEIQTGQRQPRVGDLIVLPPRTDQTRG